MRFHMILIHFIYRRLDSRYLLFLALQKFFSLTEEPTLIIDVEHHYRPADILKKRGCKPGEMVYLFDVDEGKFAGPVYEAFGDIEQHLDVMDKSGIDMAVLSGGVNNLDDAKTWNDACAKVIQQYPKRFAGFAAALPLFPLQAKDAIKEVERSIKDLGLNGVMIRPQVYGRQLDSRELWPFYEKVSELNVPIFVHVCSIPPGFDACNAPYDLNTSLVRDFDVAQAATRLCCGGVFEEFPDLKFVLSHYGGTLFAFKERLEMNIHLTGSAFWYGTEKPLISEPYVETFNKNFSKLYFNMAGRGVGIKTLKAALNFIDPRHLLFATDWPPNFIHDAEGIASYIKGIRGLDIGTRSVNDILGNNARKLLKIK